MTSRQGAAASRGAWHIVLDRNYGPYWLGTFLSACGTWFQIIAATLLVYRLTGSAFLVGMVTLAELIGMVVLAPVTGRVADRFDHRRIIVTVSVLSALIALLLGVLYDLGLLDVPILLALLFVAGVVGAFSLPAAQALVRRVVEPARLGSAVAMNSVTFNLARAVGPIAATTVIAAFGFGAGFFVNAASYIPIVIAMAVIQVRKAGAAESRPEHLPGTIATLRERPMLAGLLLVVAAIAFSSDPVGTLAPFLSTTLGRPDTDTGMITGAFGMGGVVAALVMRTGERSLRRMAIEMLVMGTSVMVLGLAFRFEVALLACFVAGFSYLTAQTAATTHLLLGTPAHVTGRIMALWGVAWLGVRPFASVVDGAIADVVGAQHASMIMALPVLIAGVAILVTPRLLGRSAHDRPAVDGSETSPHGSGPTGGADSPTA